jgi:hypothetical protein
MIQIGTSATADTRTCDFTKVSKETLLASSKQHIGDVREAHQFFSRKIAEAMLAHDTDKLTDIDGFHADFVTGFKQTAWWDRHRPSSAAGGRHSGRREPDRRARLHRRLCDGGHGAERECVSTGAAGRTTGARVSEHGDAAEISGGGRERTTGRGCGRSCRRELALPVHARIYFLF